jgi:hypothetical protein
MNIHFSLTYQLPAPEGTQHPSDTTHTPVARKEVDDRRLVSLGWALGARGLGYWWLLVWTRLPSGRPARMKQ